MQAAPKQATPQLRKRRRLVKAADVAAERLLEQLSKRKPGQQEPIDLCAGDDEGAAAEEAGHSSSEDEGGPVKLGMHVDLTRGAVL